MFLILDRLFPLHGLGGRKNRIVLHFDGRLQVHMDWGLHRVADRYIIFSPPHRAVADSDAGKQHRQNYKRYQPILYFPALVREGFT